MLDLFPDWGLLFSYTPVVAMIVGFLVLPVLMGGCYALLQPTMLLGSYEQVDQEQRKALGKKAFGFSLGMYGISVVSILFIILFSNSSISENEYHEVNSFLHSDKILLSGDTYVIPEEVKQQRQAIYEGYVKDHRLSQIEYLVMQDQVADLVKSHLKSAKHSPDDQQAKIVIYPMVNKDKQLTL